MLVVIAVLLLLLFRRASAEAFAAALIIGAIIAALPSIIFLRSGFPGEPPAAWTACAGEDPCLAQNVLALP